ncbi:hypothetical protein LQW54_007826 [Pestalotiopsis sp. IQ-011]
MSDIEGPQAARLFVEHARENRCNNVGLIQLLENGTRRDPMAESSGDKRKYLLPTKERLKDVFGPNDTLLNLLCCRCRLCDHNDGFKNLVRNAKILDDTDKRKELAILILSGCLFALKDLCTQANFQVVRFAARIPTSPPQSHPNDSSCLSRIAPVPTECSHEFFDKDNRLCLMEHICVDCRKRAFQSATTENSIVVDIPKLERTSIILDYSDQNIPFVLECPQKNLNERLTPRFFSSQIEPSCCDEELKGRTLFRKVFKFQHNQVEQIAEAEKEARIAMHLAQRDAENFVDVYFALKYTEWVYTYVEIVFPFYDRDLRHEFELQKSGRASIPRAESLLGDPLWTALLNVVNSASIMHEAIESGAVECVGHFDIKPENIVIKGDNKGAQKLFLIDFGQSAANLAGTNDYQPPEVTWPRSNTSPLELKYDVWSMACVLLEVLVFIDSGFYELQMFRARVKGSDESAMAFWQGTSPHDIVLRYAVTDRLKTLEDQGDRRTQAVIRQLRAMLRTDPANRPTMRSCLGEFTRLNLNREELGLATQDMMDCGLEKWKTSYSTSRMPRPNPGDLYFYRDKPGQAIEYATLDIESVIRDTQPLKNVSFVPRAFFNMSTKPGHTFACHFGNFHKGFTFYFSLLEQFLEFMSLLTYQRIVPDIAEDRTASGTRFEVEKCHIKIHGRIADRTRRFKGGTVQIWRQLLQTGYDRWHKRSGPLPTINSSTESSDGTGASTAGVNLKLPANVWKLALWTHDEKTNERICIVIDIGAKTWRLEDPSGRTPRRLKIKPHHGHADFRGAIFEPLTTDQDGNASEDRYPGIPISPVELQSRMQLRMKEATIELSDDIYRGQILEVLHENKFNLPG